MNLRTGKVKKYMITLGTGSIPDEQLYKQTK